MVDVRMPPGYTDEGLHAAIAIRRDHPGTGVLVFSQYIETRYTADLLGAASGGGAAGAGYLLKDRVADVGEFIEALTRVAAGGTALDPEVITQLMGASRVILILLIWFLLSHASGSPVDWPTAIAVALICSTTGIVGPAWRIRQRAKQLNRDNA